MSAYEGQRVVVAGAGVSGVPVAEALLERGAVVTVVDRAASERTDRLAAAGATVLIGVTEPPPGTQAVVTSPGWRPDHPLLSAAVSAGIEVYSEPELAWRLRPAGAAPWLAVTGTNGKTTTVTMLAAILRAAGQRAAAVGNIGDPLLSAVLKTDPPYEVLSVELSSFQLHWSSTMAPQAAALLNLADDHLDWHGGFDAYAQAKARIWRGHDSLAVGNADDPAVAKLLATRSGPTASFTLGRPSVGQLGVIDGTLVDRAFGDEVALVDAADVRPPGAHNIANALAAAALARGHGVPPEAVRDGLRGYVPEPHRNALVATVAGVSYVNDSKATNPHAALASLAAYDSIVWVAGGQLKGVDVDDLVRTVAPRLRGAVLLGVDRAEIAAAIRRHAPDVPVVDVTSTDDGVMIEVVEHAHRLARPGDAVLLAPAAASLDMFPSYGARGDSFAAAVRALAT
ncbi:UDP-N-acetylmuramoyl-L-alanine--D-glutamate ligase [Fodinicola acaciae]|uniref:UDP-N-acetylmuramoyl-L-alanine--D-glutamate ligase n=1 Tax=Fodinicola acaciae TaxID=2681555 RepID=UPI0013D0A07C|nr:UDP-N-acetylmuramoyl-L-alanine--D-glutamate ligase [Fodinicola acaciae]